MKNIRSKELSKFLQSAKSPILKWAELIIVSVLIILIFLSYYLLRNYSIFN
jgi:hypothetical protein